MGKIKQAETHIYEAVKRGEIEILPNGEIWRVAMRGGNRWTREARTVKTSRRRAEKIMPSGYLLVRAMVNHKRMSGSAHRLVWLHFNGPILPGMVINHRNGVKSDNRPENLEMITESQNAKHAVHILGRGRTLTQWGESNAMAKLNSAQVNAIRLARRNGRQLDAIAAEFGVSMQTVSKIARGDRRPFG